MRPVKTCASHLFLSSLLEELKERIGFTWKMSISQYVCVCVCVWSRSQLLVKASQHVQAAREKSQQLAAHAGHQQRRRLPQLNSLR